VEDESFFITEHLDEQTIQTGKGIPVHEAEIVSIRVRPKIRELHGGSTFPYQVLPYAPAWKAGAQAETKASQVAEKGFRKARERLCRKRHLHS
jgi:hypothetical protein